MGTSEEIDDGTIAIDKTKVFEIKPPIWLTRFFRNHRLTSKCCYVNHLVIIECLFSSKISLASLNNHFVSVSASGYSNMLQIVGPSVLILQTEHDRIKNPNQQEAGRLTIYKCGRGVEPAGQPWNVTTPPSGQSETWTRVLWVWEWMTRDVAVPWPIKISLRGCRFVSNSLRQHQYCIARFHFKCKARYNSYMHHMPIYSKINTELFM